jgi:hypothetical protein
MDGFEATAAIRRREPASGMDDYISQPVHMHELEVVVRRWVPFVDAQPAAAWPPALLVNLFGGRGERSESTPLSPREPPADGGGGEQGDDDGVLDSAVAAVRINPEHDFDPVLPDQRDQEKQHTRRSQNDLEIEALTYCTHSLTHPAS